MVTSTLVDTLRRARASWRGQLVVLLIGSILLGLTLEASSGFASMPMRMLVGWFEALLLVAASTRMAMLAEAGYEFEPEGGLLDLLFEVLQDAPRLVAHVAPFAIAPLAIGWLSLQLISGMTILGLVLVPVMLVASVLFAGPAVLAIAAVLHHDRTWAPRSTVLVVRGNLRRITAVALAGGAAAAMASVPLALIGFVATALLGIFSFAGTGLVAAGMVPWIGCGALALWRALDATVPAGTAAAADAEHGAAVAGTEDIAAAFGITSPTPAAMSWHEGPAWDVAVDPGAAWGTWIRIDAPSTMGVRVAWSAGVTPLLAFASERGTWTHPGELGSSGDVLRVELPAGSTYVQVTSRCATPQAVTVTLLVPAAAAA